MSERMSERFMSSLQQLQGQRARFTQEILPRAITLESLEMGLNVLTLA